MRIVEVAALDNGAHRNQTINGVRLAIPDGWAAVPDDLEMEHFPFGDLTVEVVNGIPTVTGWVPGVAPAQATEPEDMPTRMDILEAQVAYTAMMTDTMLEE